jgi:hypothetical protein
LFYSPPGDTAKRARALGPCAFGKKAGSLSDNKAVSSRSAAPREVTGREPYTTVSRVVEDGVAIWPQVVENVLPYGLKSWPDDQGA